MKKILLSIMAFAAVQSVNAQCSDLIISEYVEGSGNDKAIEFYNPTAVSINLSGYEVQRYSNGAFSPSTGGVTELEGTVAPYSTFVLVNGQTTVENGGNSPAVSPELQQMADQLDHGYPAPTYFNGNDALVLIKNTSEIVDIFGKPGEDPGVAWSDENGSWWTKDQTLIRKPDVKSGVTEIPSEFNVEVEYDSLPKNTWSMLGFHDCECDPNYNISVDEFKNTISFNVFPNPVSGNAFMVAASQDIKTLKIISLTGSEVMHMEGLNGKNIFVENNFTSGMYFVELTSNSGAVNTQKIIIK